LSSERIEKKGRPEPKKRDKESQGNDVFIQGIVDCKKRGEHW